MMQQPRATSRPDYEQFRSNGSSWRRHGEVQRDTVTFNVGGKLFEIQPTVIRSKGVHTLLGSLLDDIGTDSSQQIFVDANPERFQYILDWYRNGEMHLPSGCNVEGVLRDARYFLLPDTIKVNGETLSIKPSVAVDIQEIIRRKVIEKWPNFNMYVERLKGELRRQAEDLAERSDEVDAEFLENQQIDCFSENASSTHPYNHPHFRGSMPFENRKVAIAKEFVLAEVSTKSVEADNDLLEVQSMAPMFMFNEAPPPARWRWNDESNVCSEIRLRVLKNELEQQGITCSVTSPWTSTHLRRLVLRLEVQIPWNL